MNKQPWYHRLEILFTATTDLSEDANSPAFCRKLTRFLREELGTEILPKTVQLDGPCEADPGDPHDLM